MSKPEDISQEVWDSAMATVRGWPGNLTIGELVARAILAERERCALLTFAAYERKTEVCSRIIRRIRSGEGLVR